MNKNLEKFLFDIDEILTNVYDDIFPLSRSMNGNDKIISAISNLVKEVQSLFSWFIEKIRSNNIRDSRNGYLADNQTLADVLCVLKCYIDACSLYSELIYGEITTETIRHREIGNYYIHYHPHT